MKPRNPLVVIPTYNEAENIERLVKEVIEAVAGMRVLVVDDNAVNGRILADGDRRAKWQPGYAVRADPATNTAGKGSCWCPFFVPSPGVGHGWL